MQEHSLHRGGLAVALAAAIGVIASSPFVGDLRSAILAAFPAQFQLIIGGAIAVAVVAALVVALTRIRDRRGWRFARLPAALRGPMVFPRPGFTRHPLLGRL